MPNLWAGIVRVSVVGGRTGDRFHSDKDQVADIERAVAAIPGAALELLPPELDVSGGLPLEQRPSLLAAVEGVEEGRYAGIVVAYLSRLGRNVREQLRAWDRVEAAGGRIIVAREGIDTTTPSGRMHRTILLAIAESEREQHAERWAERRRVATEAGIWQRKQAPLGYTRDPATRKLVPSADADLVREAFIRRAAGESYPSLGRFLGMTSGGAWALLRNRVYLGELKVGENINSAAHPPIVSAGLFHAVAGTTGVKPSRPGAGPTSWLAGLARCQSCGFALARNTTGGRVTFLCKKRHSAGDCPQPAGVSGSRLEGHVDVIVRQQLARLQATVRAAAPDTERLAGNLAAAEAELAAYLSAVSAADVGAAAFSAGAAERKRAVDVARDALEQASTLISLPAIGASVDPLSAWEAGDNTRKGVIARTLIETVIVKPSRGLTIPIAERVRVIARGAGLEVPKNRGPVAADLMVLPWPDLDANHVLRVLGLEEGL